MSSTFNPQILVEKLLKLNSSQQSIETLSHWCIFHMHKAKQVVETWDRQFHCSPREQRVAFLFLANDILQNSRRKGVEFVAEFWKVLPDALRDVIENGDEAGKNAALRMISIWDERKVFGSRGQILKEEFMKKQLDSGNRNMKQSGFKPKPPSGNALDKLVSGYEAVYGSKVDEDAIFNKCRNAISFVQNVDNNIEVGHVNGSITDELKGHHAILRDCIEQLSVVESSRANLVTVLREALQEQEYKLDQVRIQLQQARTHSGQADGIYRHILGGSSNGQVLEEKNQNGSPATLAPQSFAPRAGEPSTSVIYTPQFSFAAKSSHIEEDTKSAAAAVAAKLTASTSSAQMLTYVLSSLASEGVIGNTAKESSSDHPFEKRAKIENDHHPSYVPPRSPQNNLPITTGESNPDGPLPPASPPPPLPSSPPPLLPPMHPYPMPQYMPNAMAIPNGSYGYNPSQPPPLLPATHPSYGSFGPPANGISTFAPPANFSHGYPTEGGYYSQPTSLPMAPMGHHQ